jgi:hypothetical protein
MPLRRSPWREIANVISGAEKRLQSVMNPPDLAAHGAACPVTIASGGRRHVLKYQQIWLSGV